MARGHAELRDLGPLPANWTPAVHEALLAAALCSGSDVSVLPWQDVLGTKDRINLPGSMSDANWSYRVEQHSDELLSHPQTKQAAQLLARLTERSGRY